MANIKVSPTSLQGPANVYGRASDALSSRIAGTFSGAANLSAADFGDPAADAAYEQARQSVTSSLPRVADALMAMAKTLASAAGGYLESDTTSSTLINGLPNGDLQQALRTTPGVPLPPRNPIPNDSTALTNTSYHIAPGGSGG